MAHREIVCSCGHKMKAANDEALYSEVRHHVNAEHPELKLSADDIREMIRTKAYDN